MNFYFGFGVWGFGFMRIAGLQKLTLIDFPGHVAATVFTQGCPFRCGFCHNPELVLPEKYEPILSEKQIFNFLESRYGKLTGICITGGEPLMQSDIDKFISHMKALGFAVKLDTNGYYPDRLKKIIADGDVDYIAMDIKSSPTKYAMTIFNGQLSISNQIPKSKTQSVIPSPTFVGVNSIEGSRHSVSAGKNLENRIRQSIGLIVNSGIDYEFRTTVAKPLHSVEDFEGIGQLIKGAKRFFIQNYVKSKHIDESTNFEPFTDKELKEAKKIMKKYVMEVGIR